MGTGGGGGVEANSSRLTSIVNFSSNSPAMHRRTDKSCSFQRRAHFYRIFKRLVDNDCPLILQDRREFAKFEKERQNAQWDTVSL